MENNAKGNGNSRDNINIWSAPVTAMVLWFRHSASRTWKSAAPVCAGSTPLLLQVCETGQGKKINAHTSGGHITCIQHHNAGTVHRHIHKWLPDWCCPVPEMQAAVSFLPNTFDFGTSAAPLAAVDRRVSKMQGSIKWNSHLAFLWVLDSAQVIIQNISHLQTIYNNIINNVFPVIHFTVKETAFSVVATTNSSHCGFYIIAFSPFTYVYTHNSYTNKRSFRSSFVQLNYQKTLLIQHFLGFCPRALGFTLLCSPPLADGEMLLPVILSHPPCTPLVHNYIFRL